MKSILFLSALDFKAKSIQVIRKTPEAYAAAGWQVTYIVARDNVSNGNYSYEEEINPEGINTIRIYWPFPWLRSRAPRYLGLLLTKLSAIAVVWQLRSQARRQLKTRKFDVIYGYEIHGTLALGLISSSLTTEKIVTRFQGSFINEMLENRQWSRLLFNLDSILALRKRADLTIMTNDGTKGDRAIEKIRNTKHSGIIKFWANGVDPIPQTVWPEEGAGLRLISISRLANWKRVDRGIRIVKSLVSIGFNNFEYHIVGEGPQRGALEKLAVDLGVSRYVIFRGALTHKETVQELVKAQIFFSMYDSSNVGNPLLEAIRAEKIILTLNNGDTSRWINHGVNGYIYDLQTDFYQQAAMDILNVVGDSEKRQAVLSEVHRTAKKMLWTWEERFAEEVSAVRSL